MSLFIVIIATNFLIGSMTFWRKNSFTNIYTISLKINFLMIHLLVFTGNIFEDFRKLQNKEPISIFV